MQKILESAAKWYLSETNFTLPQMREDLLKILRHRRHAFENGDIKQVYKVFACTEIVKAAICLTTGEPYDTSFSKFELGLIKKISGDKPLFVCRKCGKVYPAEAFAPNSEYCIECAKEIRLVKKMCGAYKRSGYLSKRGAIICYA